MLTSQREKWADAHMIALVELDMQKMRVRIFLAREAIRERLQELEHPRDHHGERRGIEDAPELRTLENEARTTGPLNISPPEMRAVFRNFRRSRL